MPQIENIMKKLVKTAKQQFEQRLQELHVVKRWELCSTEVYHHCIDNRHDFILLREQDGEYKELRYGLEYETVVLGERFLSAMTERLSQGSLPVKPLFDWYASADHDDESFNLLDVYMCELESEHHTFEDLYEEVPDIRIITAREQWENDSAEAKATQVNESGYTYRIVPLATSIDFYVCTPDGDFCRKRYPSLDELRRDSTFVINYIDWVRNSHPEDLESALYWLAQGKYTMSECSMMDIYNVATCRECIDYEDKQYPEAEFQKLKDEAESLRKKLVSHIEHLCELGLTINQEVLCSRYTLSCADGDALCTDPLKEIYTLKNDAAEWILCYREQPIETESYHLDKLSIDTLLHIIESLQ